MRGFVLFNLILILSVVLLCSTLNNGRNTLSPEVTFLEDQPVVDGRLDDHLLDQLIPRRFNFRINLNLFKGSAGANYRLAYGTDFMYVYLEAVADSFICRDRGYQNGDGFILTLSKTIRGADKSAEHFVMGFSSQDRPEQEWAEKILWNYNGRVMLERLPDDLPFAYHAGNGKISFELVLPWSGVYPYHPLLSEGIGFNLWFMKAFPGRRFPNTQGVAFEIPAETGSRRYRVLAFEKPELENNCQSYAILDKNHCYRGETVRFQLASIAAREQTEEFHLSVFNENGQKIRKMAFKVVCAPGISYENLEIKTAEFLPGQYSISWQGKHSHSSGEMELSIMPEFDHESLLHRLEKLTKTISDGSLNSIKFHLQETKNKLSDLKDYETCPNLISDLYALYDHIEEMELGTDNLARQPGVFRRAFLSRLDSTLQPYKILVPGQYDKLKSYPLLLFLHGSGRTDEDMFDLYHPSLSEGNFIQIAPSGIGVSHYYGTNEAQTDIVEALQDILLNYAIDTTRIILAGFSMGGYGVYRTYIESPERFAGLVVLSGEPRVGFLRRSRHGFYPDFLREKNIARLGNIPVFIYHGTNDLNCPYKRKKKLVEKMLASGLDVTFVFDDGAGHSGPKDPAALASYYKWLNEITN